jgi:5-methylcytosine-specific restriction endonuclease McrA
MRREFSAKTKVAAYERSQGRCEGCGAALQTARFHYDHVLPDALGGEPTLENCEVLCRACHDEKTHKSDVPRISKMKRQRVRNLGAKTTARPIPGSKASGIRRRMNGTVEKW